MVQHLHSGTSVSSLLASSTILVKPAEPFGDASKRHARLAVLQRTVEITCTGVTNGGVITGNMFVGQGGQRRDYTLELVASGLATVDQRKIDYGEAPKQLVDAQLAAQKNRVGIWSLGQPSDEVSRHCGSNSTMLSCFDLLLLNLILFCHDRKRLPLLKANIRQRLLRFV
jgi:endonuclease YncB( thermonuclease family)